MTIDAKIFNINYPSPNIIELVIRKKKGDAYFPICFVGFSNIIDIVKDLALEPSDKIRIYFTIKSKKHTYANGTSRYFTSAIIDNIELLEKNVNRQMQVVFVDSETGEIL